MASISARGTGVGRKARIERRVRSAASTLLTGVVIGEFRWNQQLMAVSGNSSASAHFPAGCAGNAGRAQRGLAISRRPSAHRLRLERIVGLAQQHRVRQAPRAAPASARGRSRSERSRADAGRSRPTSSARSMPDLPASPTSVNITLIACSLRICLRVMLAFGLQNVEIERAQQFGGAHTNQFVVFHQQNPQPRFIDEIIGAHPASWVCLDLEIACCLAPRRSRLPADSALAARSALCAPTLRAYRAC